MGGNWRCSFRGAPPPVVRAAWLAAWLAALGREIQLEEDKAVNPSEWRTDDKRVAKAAYSTWREKGCAQSGRNAEESPMQGKDLESGCSDKSARKGNKSGTEAQGRTATYVPVWREGLNWFEYLQLKTSRVYYCVGVPRGDNSPVIVIPGFLGTNLCFLEMRLWLRRLGYRALGTGIWINAECPEIAGERLVKIVSKEYAAHGRKVHLIGHSLGGLIARGIAYQSPDKVASLIMLGSPFREVKINPFVAYGLDFVRDHVSTRRDCSYMNCFSLDCPCPGVTMMKGRFPSSVNETAVYSKNDGFVDWQVCMNGNSATDVEVRASHLGLRWNPEVYRVIAERLAMARPQTKPQTKRRR